MIEYKTGNLFEEEVDAIVNTVNCVGVMGRGIALQFKKKYPENFKAYAAACKRNEIQPGQLFVFEAEDLAQSRHCIVNFPTKRHWRDKSRIEDIDSGLQALVNLIREQKISSIAIPPLGCGLGGLDWNLVRLHIARSLENLPDVRVVVFEPKGTPAAEKMISHRKVPNMTPGRAALIELMHRYLMGLLDPFVTLLEVHKLMYFLQVAGEPLSLKYKKALYGPYAENLRHVLHVVEGHFISGYADGGDTPYKQLALIPGAYEEATRFLSSHQETQHHYAKVADLVDGFESPFGLELLSTVHWVVAHEQTQSREDVIRHTYAWNDRKKQFTPHQISIAVDVLSTKGWIDIKNWKEQ